MTDSQHATVLDSLVLNQVQKDAVTYSDGPQLVFAGAGTGKTRVLTAKIAYLIQTRNILPNHIFAATFTNKAAREMQERVEQLIGTPCGGLWIGTFHSLCARILRREAARIGYTSSFTIYDSDDQLTIIKETLRELNVDERTLMPRAAQHIVSSLKSKCLTPAICRERAQSFGEQQTATIYERYQTKLKNAQAMDFDDLLLNVVLLFGNDTACLNDYRHLFAYVLVDEYQDTNAVQFKLVHLLSAQHRNIFVVGDDDQSIYGWRGADVANILSFEKSFPGAKTFRLEQNYRSGKSILDFANAAIIANINRAQKQLWTSSRNEGSVTVSLYADDRAEASGIADRIENAQRSGSKYREMSVLYRTNAQSRVFEDAFRRRKIPYVLVGGTSFYERKEIKDCLAYLRLLVNPCDNLSFDRIVNVPARGVGEKTRELLVNDALNNNRSLMDTLMHADLTFIGGKTQKRLDELKTVFELLRDMVAKNEQPNEVLEQILRLTGYADMLQEEQTEEAASRIENINELLNALVSWSEDHPTGTLAEFLEEVTLSSDVDRWKSGDDAVSLMTLHSSKGLEFKLVFLVGLEDGIIPSRQNFDDESKIEEERRLFYVGITRAKERLECSLACQRMRFGAVLFMDETRFLQPIPKTLFKFDDLSSYVAPSARQAERPGVRQARTSFGAPGAPKPAVPAAGPRSAPQPEYDGFSQEAVQFHMGQRIMHKLYGPGRIMTLSGFGADMRMTVLFNDGIRRKIMAKFANVE